MAPLNTFDVVEAVFMWHPWIPRTKAPATQRPAPAEKGMSGIGRALGSKKSHEASSPLSLTRLAKFLILISLSGQNPVLWVS